MDQHERARIQYDIESLVKAVSHEKNVRNRTLDSEDYDYCARTIRTLEWCISNLHRRLKGRRKKVDAPVRVKS